jgi:molybdopterin-guanine dinucleotide biosynthesis protein A
VNGPAAFRGVVLTGGASRRMGRDKAFVEVDGRPMVRIAAAALSAAGARAVHCVGGDQAALSRLGLDAVADLHPGEGPLGGLAVALRLADPALPVMVLTCDLVRIDAATVLAVLAGLAASPAAALAAPVVDGRPQYLTAAYRPARCADAVDAAFAAGERAVRAGLRGLAVAEVHGLDPAALADADTPDALPPAASGR